MASDAEIATAWVRLVPSFEGLQGTIAKEFGGASSGLDAEGQKAGGFFSKGVGKSVKSLAGIIGGAFVAGKVIGFFKDSMDAVQNWQTLNAQTSAVVKSTGGAANVTADQIHGLSQALEGQTATEAESIQSGANMLLTFKNIQNGVGKGNDIFNQATTSLVDMSRAMGTDPKTAAIQLGKALNDPIQGISALSRVGIQFTDDQKAMIKSLVEGGRTMDAQKIILGELNSQFGGSGKSYADTQAGKMFLFQDAVGDLGEMLMGALVPALTTAAEVGTTAFNWLGEHQPVLIGIVAIIGVALVAAFVAWTASIWASTAALLANPITWVVLAIAALVAGLVWVATQTTFFQDVWTAAVDIIGAVISWVWTSVIKPVVDALVAAWNWVAGAVQFAGDLISTIVGAVGAAFTWFYESVIKPVFDGVAAVFTWIYQNIILPIVTGIMIYIGLWAAVLTWLWTSVIQPVFGLIGGLFGWIYNSIIVPIITGIGIYFQILGAVFTWLYENVVLPVFNAIGAVILWVWTSVIEPVVSFIQLAIAAWGMVVDWLWNSVISPAFAGIGALFQWIWDSVISPVISFISQAISSVGAVFSWLWANAISPAFEAVGAAFQWIWNSIIMPVANFISDAITTVGDTIHNVFSGISDFIGSAFQSVLSVVRGPINALISLINGVIGGLNSIHVTIPDWVPLVGGQSFGVSIPKIPMLADGGTILRGGSVLVGERGPEVLTLPRGATVDPNISGGGDRPIYADGSLAGWVRELANGEAVLVWNQGDRGAEMRTVGGVR